MRYAKIDNILTRSDLLTVTCLSSSVILMLINSLEVNSVISTDSSEFEFSVSSCICNVNVVCIICFSF